MLWLLSSFALAIVQCVMRGETRVCGLAHDDRIYNVLGQRSGSVRRHVRVRCVAYFKVGMLKGFDWDVKPELFDLCPPEPLLL